MFGLSSSSAASCCSRQCKRSNDSEWDVVPFAHRNPPRAVAASWCNRRINDARCLLGLPPVLRWLPGMPGLPPVGRLPTGRIVELPGRGSTYVVDSGPVADAPTFILLHGIA